MFDDGHDVFDLEHTIMVVIQGLGESLAVLLLDLLEDDVRHGFSLLLFSISRV